MRNMSFRHTTEQIRNRTKTVTRRLGWWFLKPGDEICAVEKAMGLKKGEKIKKICPIVIISVRLESLQAVTLKDCVMEGFPDMTPPEFVAFFCEKMRCSIDTKVNRIQFDYKEKG